MINEAELQHKNRDELINFVCSLQEENQLQEKQFQERILSQQQFIDYLYEQIKLLKHGQFGVSSERFTDDNPQGRLFDEAQLPANQQDIETAEEEILIPEHKRKPGRKALPKDLPREQVVYDLPEAEKICHCGCQLTCIGDERTEQLDVIPAKIYVIEHIQKKYACKGCSDTIKTATKAAQPIPKSMAAPGL